MEGAGEEGVDEVAEEESPRLSIPPEEAWSATKRAGSMIIAAMGA